MFLNENKVIYFQDIKKENMDYEKIIHDLDLQSENLEYEAIPLKGNRKRMRLHQLSWEEKLQRKKLRNRIAAQTSRDRKKAKMDYLEETVKDLKQQNDLLFMEVQELKKKNELLVDVNNELKKVISVRPYTCSCLRKPEGKMKKEEDKLNEVQNSTSVSDDHSFLRPAESFEIPQQKGEWLILTQIMTMSPSWKLWKIFLLYLLSQKCWEISKKTKSFMSLKDWQQVCWKKLNSMSAEEIHKILSISSNSQTKWACNNEMVGTTPEIMESHCSKTKNLEKNILQQQYLTPNNFTIKEIMRFIALEHSYALQKMLSPQETQKTDSENKTLPSIKVSEPEIILDSTNSQKIFHTEIEESLEKLDIPFFPNFCSPRSEASSDLGYESIASPYGSDLSTTDTWNELWGDTLPDLFPELI